MKILFATGHPHMPQFTGGSQSTVHDLTLDLVERGHSVSVLASLWSNGYLGLRNRILMKFLRRDAVRDDMVGYPVYRKWFVWENLGPIMRKKRPDAAMVHAMLPARIAHALVDEGVPTVMYLHDVKFEDLGADIRTLKGVEFVANSRFTARAYADEFGIEARVVPPMFRKERYMAPRAPENVTFINPHPDKGLDLALAIARLCPEIPFVFQESWPLDDGALSALNAQLEQLPNVTLQRRTDDIASVYAKARIVLAPSQCEEAWGRVATEAQFNGIPVLASDRGGLPEAVGPGGTLLDPDQPAEVWAAELKRLWLDQAYYEEKSRAGLVYAEREEIDAGWQVTALLEALETARSNWDLHDRPQGY